MPSLKYSAIDVPFIIKWGMASYWLRQRNTIRRYDMRPLVVQANYLQALS
jgi:hypothetical protein